MEMDAEWSPSAKYYGGKKACRCSLFLPACAFADYHSLPVPAQLSLHYPHSEINWILPT